MILGYEDPVQMPTMDIYSTDLMKTYIAGVKDLYDKGQEEYKDFMKAYQDFYSPIAGDTEAYYNYTIGGAQKLLDQFYQNGIDPFKSREGRAAITRYINSVPVGALNAMKQNAENRKAYDRAKAELAAKGLYNPGYEDYRLKSLGLDNFSTVDPNTGQIRVWDRYSPDVYSGVFDTTNEWFKGLEDSYMGKTSDGRYNIFGVGTDQMAPILNQNLPDYLDTPLGAYNYDLFRRTLSPETTPDQALDLFKDFIMAANSRVRHQTIKEDPYMLDSVRTQNDIRSHATNAATDHYYWGLEHPDGDTSVSNRNSRVKDPDGKYSHYTQLNQASTNVADELLQKHGWVQMQNNNGEWVYAKRNSNGTYRQLKWEDAYEYILDREKDPGGKNRHAYDVFSVIDFPNSLLGGIEMPTTFLKDKIYTIDDLDHNVDRHNKGGFVRSKSVTKFINNNENNIRFVQVGTAAQIKQKNGKYGIFVEVKAKPADANATTKLKDIPSQRLIAKIGEYERDADGYLVPTNKWSSFMATADHSISNIGGSPVSTENVIK